VVFLRDWPMPPHC